MNFSQHCSFIAQEVAKAKAMENKVDDWLGIRAAEREAIDLQIKTWVANGEIPAWQPIETAPKDGSHVQMYTPELQFVGFYADVGWCYVAPGCPLAPKRPTHWMPLQKAPAA